MPQSVNAAVGGSEPAGLKWRQEEVRDRETRFRLYQQKNVLHVTDGKECKTGIVAPEVIQRKSNPIR
jgi:hypothetical protein